MAQRDQDIEQKSQKKQNKGEVHDCTSEQAYGHLACSTRCHSAQTRIRSSRSHRLENLCSCFLLGHLLLRVLPPVRSYHDVFFLFYRRSRSQISPYTACGNIRFSQSRLRPLSLLTTLHLRCLKSPKYMGNTRPSSQSSSGCTSSLSTPSRLPRACTIPGRGELRVNFWG